MNHRVFLSNISAQLDKTSKNNFKDILKKLGGWPVLDGNYWDESNFDWKKLDNKLRSMGYSMNHFISFYVAFDASNSSRRVIYVSCFNDLKKLDC